MFAGTITRMGVNVGRVTGHGVTEISVARAYRPYDRLVLRNPAAGRSFWTVLACDRKEDGWLVTGFHCPPDCRLHQRRGWIAALK